MHAHWGDKPGKGSEHTLDGKMFDAELHIVHYNAKYGDPSVAVDKPDGLAVLGMFIKTGKSHPEFEKLCQNLKTILTKDKSVELQEMLDPTNLLPSNETKNTNNFRRKNPFQMTKLSSPTLALSPPHLSLSQLLGLCSRNLLRCPRNRFGFKYFILSIINIFH